MRPARALRHGKGAYAPITRIPLAWASPTPRTANRRAAPPSPWVPHPPTASPVAGQSIHPERPQAIAVPQLHPALCTTADRARQTTQHNCQKAGDTKHRTRGSASFDFSTTRRPFDNDPPAAARNPFSAGRAPNMTFHIRSTRSDCQLLLMTTQPLNDVCHDPYRGSRTRSDDSRRQAPRSTRAITRKR